MLYPLHNNDSCGNSLSSYKQDSMPRDSKQTNLMEGNGFSDTITPNK